MKKQPQSGPAFDVEDAFGSFLDTAGRAVFWIGLLATVISVGFLLVTYNAFSSSTPPGDIQQALANVSMLSKVLLAGVVGLAVGSSYMFWGEETLGVFQIMGAALLWFAPLFVPGFLGGSNVTEASSAAMAAIQMGGTIGGAIAIVVLVFDIASRVKLRARVGTKADQLKYGKGVKEEPAVRNVFMGMCWQLPFCRKFVRDKCPIYHARRTCWRERVGCMCEEEVIRGAMENKSIPKDIVAAAKYIPRNNKLNEKQKAERCRQCVIFNEHQKHKYKLALPLLVGGFAGLYVLFRTPLLGATNGIIKSLDKVFSGLTFSKTNTVETTVNQTPAFQELFLICILIVLLAYALKFLEYAVFKLKV